MKRKEKREEEKIEEREKTNERKGKKKERRRTKGKERKDARKGKKGATSVMFRTQCFEPKPFFKTRPTIFKTGPKKKNGF